ncbi:MAG: hypothetical protein IKX59_10540 [Bacteroidales bacterium]|nr:hypothetical protein [Bacteroidales bacterium]
MQYRKDNAHIFKTQSTLTADRVLPPFAETSWRPTKNFRDKLKNYNGRQSTCYNGGKTPTADRVHDAAQ